MADAAHVSIVFCGGCNPRIDRGRLAGELASRLAARGCRLSYNRRDADLLIYLSGCTADCARHDGPPGVPGIAVAAAAVDAVAVPEADLAAAVIEKADQYLQMKR
ncbi:hypothetical protein [Anaeroselena agilis]|uniref:Metal-binding protein n=1 Tax=Anaeroselena agilis TaxID=3063788 RepID=A0ABU3P0A2_9FIRM|nr:hypothetical protein [Selenomonadales bacterium 4137-cl]